MTQYYFKKNSNVALELLRNYSSGEILRFDGVIKIRIVGELGRNLYHDCYSVTLISSNISMIYSGK